MNKLINLETKENQIVVSSREVSKNFGKQHKHIIETIDNIIAENSALTEMFFETTYKAGTGKNYKMYLMNRDGFTLLVMGFTGKKAMEWKLKYIEAFNEMEKEISTPKLFKPMEMLKMMFSGMEELETRINVLENDKTISQSEYTEIGIKIKNRINKVIKEEHIVLTRKQRQKLFHEFNHDVLIVGGVKHRNQIKKNDYYKILDFINDWNPSRATVVGILGYEQTCFKY